MGRGKGQRARRVTVLSSCLGCRAAYSGGVPPTTSYAKSGEVSIAYQVVGEGPTDLVLVPGFVSNVEAAWGWPNLARFLHRLASVSRLIVFDKRGTGLSDPMTRAPTLEERMDDIRAVMDAAGDRARAAAGCLGGRRAQHRVRVGAS